MGVVCSDRCIMGQVVDWHGGLWVMVYGFWIWVDLGVFLGIFWVDHVASTFSGLISVSWVKLQSKWLRHFSWYFLG